MGPIHDRGAKKWAGIMLPEHKRLLQALYESPAPYYKSKSEEEKIRHQIMQLVGRDFEVSIDYNPQGTVYVFTGRILCWNAQEQEITLLDGQGECRVLKMLFIQALHIEPDCF